MRNAQRPPTASSLARPAGSAARPGPQGAVGYGTGASLQHALATSDYRTGAALVRPAPAGKSKADAEDSAVTATAPAPSGGDGQNTTKEPEQATTADTGTPAAQEAAPAPGSKELKPDAKTALRDLAEHLGAPGEAAADSGLTLSQLADFAAKLQMIDAGGRRIADLATWTRVRAGGSEVVLVEAAAESLELPRDAVVGRSLADVLGGVSISQRSGSDDGPNGPSSPGFWSNYWAFKDGKITEGEFSHRLGLGDPNGTETEPGQGGTPAGSATGPGAGKGKGKGKGSQGSTGRPANQGRSGAGGRPEGGERGANNRNPGGKGAGTGSGASSSNVAGMGNQPDGGLGSEPSKGKASYTVTAICRNEDGSTDVYFTRSGGDDGLDGEYCSSYDGNGHYTVFNVSEGVTPDDQAADGSIIVGGGFGSPPSDDVVGKTTDQYLGDKGDESAVFGGSNSNNDSGNSSGSNSNNDSNNDSNGNSDDDSNDDSDGDSDSESDGESDSESTSESDSSESSSSDEEQENADDTTPNPNRDDSYNGPPLWMLNGRMGAAEKRNTERAIASGQGGGYTDPGAEGSETGGGSVMTPQQQHLAEISIAHGRGGDVDGQDAEPAGNIPTAADFKRVAAARGKGVTDPSEEGGSAGATGGGIPSNGMSPVGPKPTAAAQGSGRLQSGAGRKAKLRVSNARVH